MQPLNYRSKADLVAGRLRDEILSGELRAGTTLKQRDIAERFGVSPTPVREAMARLAMQGLVMMEAHCPPTVALQEDERIRENYLVRSTLESLAVRLAVDRIDAATLDEMEADNDKLRQLTTEDPEVGPLNRHFHTLLVEAAGVPLLTHLISQLWAALPRGPRAAGRSTAESARQHQSLIEALRDGDVTRATKTIEDHIMVTAEHMAGLRSKSGTR